MHAAQPEGITPIRLPRTLKHAISKSFNNKRALSFLGGKYKIKFSGIFIIFGC